jgi:hypothetical protein
MPLNPEQRNLHSVDLDLSIHLQSDFQETKQFQGLGAELTVMESESEMGRLNYLESEMGRLN